MTEILDNELKNNRPPIQKNKILRVNAIIFVAYTLLSLLGGSSAVIFHAFFIVIHVALCVLIGIAAAVSSKSDDAKYHFLSAGLVLLIGFGICMGIGNVFTLRI